MLLAFVGVRKKLEVPAIKQGNMAKTTMGVQINKDMFEKAAVSESSAVVRAVCNTSILKSVPDMLGCFSTAHRDRVTSGVAPVARCRGYCPSRTRRCTSSPIPRTARFSAMHQVPVGEVGNEAFNAVKGIDNVDALKVLDSLFNIFTKRMKGWAGDAAKYYMEDWRENSKKIARLFPMYEVRRHSR